jgi:hypothetical protein
MLIVDSTSMYHLINILKPKLWVLGIQLLLKANYPQFQCKGKGGRVIKRFEPTRSVHEGKFYALNVTLSMDLISMSWFDCRKKSFLIVHKQHRK